MIREHREELGLNACCRALGVSKGTWHYREQRRKAGPDPEEERIKEAVREIIAEHPSYGYRRIRPELEERLGERINHKRLRRLLREWDLALEREVSHSEPSGVVKILRRRDGNLNLVRGRDPGPLEVLVTDFTELRYGGGGRRAQLIALKDVGSRWVPGWAVGPSPDRELALTAWQRAERRFERVGRPLAGVVVHHDRDAVFTSYDWLRALMLEAEAVISYAERGAKDNPWIESLWSRFKDENQSRIAEAESMTGLREVVDEGFRYHNRRRRHSSLDYRSPIEFLRAEGILTDSP